MEGSCSENEELNNLQKEVFRIHNLIVGGENLVRLAACAFVIYKVFCKHKRTESFFIYVPTLLVLSNISQLTMHVLQYVGTIENDTPRQYFNMSITTQLYMLAHWFFVVQYLRTAFTLKLYVDDIRINKRIDEVYKKPDNEH